MITLSIGYKTKQKQVILNCLADRSNEPLSAKDVYTLCEQNGAPVGLATVYRHLESLTADNIIKRIVTDINKVFYQYSNNDSGTDFYLKCNHCGRILPISCNTLHTAANHVAEAHGFQIDNAKSIFYGHCNNCIGTKTV